jgi:hypothetical protein
MNNTVYSIEQSNYNAQQQGTQDSRLNKSFIDNKPMIQGLVRSILKVEKGGEAHLINTGLTDVEGAKQIASNLFAFYDKDRSGSIDSVKVNYRKLRQIQSLQMLIEFLTPTLTLKRKTSIHFFQPWMSTEITKLLSKTLKASVYDISQAQHSEFHTNSKRVKWSKENIDLDACLLK